MWRFCKNQNRCLDKYIHQKLLFKEYNCINLNMYEPQSQIRYAVLSVYGVKIKLSMHNKTQSSKLPSTKPQASALCWSLSMFGRTSDVMSLLHYHAPSSYSLHWASDDWPHVPPPGLTLLLLLGMGRGRGDARHGPAQWRVDRQHARHRATRDLGVVEVVFTWNMNESVVGLCSVCRHLIETNGRGTF